MQLRRKVEDRMLLLVICSEFPVCMLVGGLLCRGGCKTERCCERIVLWTRC